MRRRVQIAVIGSGDDFMEPAVSHARLLGELIAGEGWTVVSGGRNAGVMRAVNEGAKRVAGSVTVGILPGADAEAAPGVDVVVVTGIGNARNNVIVLSADAVVACGVDGPGTASEVALALKNGKPVVLLAADEASQAFFGRIGKGRVMTAATPREAVELVRRLLDEGSAGLTGTAGKSTIKGGETEKNPPLDAVRDDAEHAVHVPSAKGVETP